MFSALIEKLHEVNPHFRNSPVYHYTPKQIKRQ